ncbi:MAG: hypothetical protein ACRDSK_24945 [Actinophytocola sp.]|uniref:hypothetical protein n=1 Tax=Actinophytocola sp. TaxID=1872138 RepID=UPI003D6AA4C2
MSEPESRQDGRAEERFELQAAIRRYLFGLPLGFGVVLALALPIGHWSETKSAECARSDGCERREGQGPGAGPDEGILTGARPGGLIDVKFVHVLLVAIGRP